MPIDVRCNGCQTEYLLDDIFVGKQVKCRHCGNTFTISPSSDAPGADPFENAVFESPKPKAPPVPALKLYNPIDTAIKVQEPVEEAAPLGRPGLNYETKKARRYTTAGADSASLNVLIVYLLGSVAAGAYITYQIYNLNNVKPAIASALVGQVWGLIAVSIVFFFLFVATMTLGGIWSAAKMMKFPLADGAYMRACGVAALPGAIYYTCLLAPFPFNLLLLLAALPITYYMVTMVFETTWVEGFVSFVLGGIGWLIGGGFAFLLMGVVVGGSIVSLHAKAIEEDNKERQEKLLAKSPHLSETATPAVTPPSDAITSPAVIVPPQADHAALDQFAQLVERTTNADLSKSNREDRMPDVQQLNAQLQQLSPYYHHDPLWVALQQKVEAFAKAVDALPTAVMDQTAFVDIPDNVDDWTVGKLSRGKLAPEISFKDFKLQVPEDMKLDLAFGEDAPDGMVWNGPNGSSQLRIVLRPRKDPKQRRPVIATKASVKQLSEDGGLLTYDGNEVTSSIGQINGIPLTKIVVNPASIGEKFTEYVAAVDGNWLILHLNSPSEAVAARTLDAAARTIRKIDTGEAKADPFSPSALAPRLADDAEHAKPLLRAQGAKAENAVVALLQSDDGQVKRRALEILQDIATEKSLAALKTAAVDPDPINAELARQAISRIRPGDMAANPNQDPAQAPAETMKADDLLRLMADLGSSDASRKKEAVGKLAFVTPAPQQRQAIVNKLAAMLRARDGSVPTADIVAAFAHWGDQSSAAELLPMLSENTDADSRRAAMQLLGTLKCVKTAAAVVRWIKLDPIHASDSLIEMGEGAEPAVIPQLADTDPVVEIDAARILERIGTRKSVTELTRASRFAKDPAVKAAAQIALDAVNARLADERHAPAGK